MLYLYQSNFSTEFCSYVLYYFSCFEETYSYLLTYVGELGSDSVQFNAVHESLTHICDHIDQENAQPLWSVIKVSTACTYSRVHALQLEGLDSNLVHSPYCW